MSRVGEKIKEARLKNGITQKALAKKLGVAEKFINEVETGRKIINESLVGKISKVLNTDLNDISMVVTDKDLQDEMVRERQERVKAPTKPNTEVNEMWNQAFGSVLKNVPIYDYNLTKVQGHKLLSMSSNKIEGHSSDKVFYLLIEQNDMVGFRIQKDDLALCHSIKEIENNSICLIEVNGKRAIRQIKRLDNMKVLLINNSGSLRTETVGLKEIKPIAKVDKIEFTL